MREQVKWFVEQMEETLKRNDHKGGWEDETLSWLFVRMMQEANELDNEIVEVDADWNKLILQAVDVANFAMMIADKARKMMNTV